MASASQSLLPTLDAMNLLLRLAAVFTLLSLTACLSFPTDRASLREAQPNPVTFNFEGPISEVTSAIVESAQECGSRWRESMLGMVAAPPRFDVRLSDQTASKSVVEIWSMNALSPDYMYELFVLRSTETGTKLKSCLLYTSPSPRDLSTSRMPSSA